MGTLSRLGTGTGAAGHSGSAGPGGSLASGTLQPWPYPPSARDASLGKRSADRELEHTPSGVRVRACPAQTTAAPPRRQPRPLPPGVREHTQSRLPPPEGEHGRGTRRIHEAVPPPPPSSSRTFHHSSGHPVPVSSHSRGLPSDDRQPALTLQVCPFGTFPTDGIAPRVTSGACASLTRSPL